MTQGETEAELRENPVGVFMDISGGLVKNVRMVDEPVVPA